MDEIEYKLKSNNVILVTEAIDKLVDLLVKSSKDKIDLDDPISPMTFLKEKCLSEDSVVSLTASKGFLSLVAGGFLEIVPAMSVAVSMLPSAKNYSAITSIISGILALIVEQSITPEAKYTCQWTLISPQHPLVMVLQQHPKAVDDILNQVESICLYNSTLTSHSIELMRSVFLWILCDPQESQSIQVYHRAVNILRGLENCPNHNSLVLECLLWQKTSGQSKRATCIHTSILDLAILRKKDDFVFATLLSLGNMAVENINCKDDPRVYFTHIKAALTYPGIERVSELLLAILSEAIQSCPVSYLNELVTICNSLHKMCGYSMSNYMFLSVLLQWLYYPTSLTSNINSATKETVESILKSPRKDSSKHTLTLSTSKIFNLIKETNNRIYCYAELIVNHEKIVASKENFDIWIERSKMSNNIQIYLYMNALLLKKVTSNESIDKVSVWKVLKDLVMLKKELATGMLPVLLCSLKYSRNPKEMVEFLQGIVHLAITKENIPIVVQILEGFKNDNTFPKSILIDLYNILVSHQTRCYPYLQEFLVDTKIGSSDAEWEVLTAKASAVKYICEEKAANFGSEMVPMISSLLNRCTDSSSGVAYCLTLEALKALWEGRIVAPVSTWKALAPKIGKDKRPIVQVGVCKLLATVPKLNQGTPEYDTLILDAVSKLWCYVVDSHYPEVTIEALTALSNFSVEQMTLKQIPEIYRRGLQLPASYCTTPSDAARKPEDVLNYIPSECWGNLFRYTNQAALDGVTILCNKLIARELSGYRSGVYATTDGQGTKFEPQTAQYLPAASVVRGLLEFVRKQSSSPTYECPESSFIECLHCLSLWRPRPLPPLQWNFLGELEARGAHFTRVLLPLAAHQAIISFTALRFINNYIPTIQINNEEEDQIYKFIETLPALCRISEPEFMKDTLNKIIKHSLQNSNGEQNEMFPMIMKYFKECLVSDKISEKSRNMLSDITEIQFENFDCDHKFWPDLVSVCCELSLEYLERMTAPSSWWELTSNMLRKSTCVRSQLAVTSTEENRLAWLNEIIDAAITMPKEHTFVLHNVCSALLLTKSWNKDWLLQLMARTQVHMVENTSTEQSVIFLCDVVILSVIIFSNYSVFTWRDNENLTASRATRLSLLPQAVSSLLNIADWSECGGQILEWLHHTRCHKFVPKQYAEAFYVTLIANRASPYAKKQNIWTKILSTKTGYQDIL